MIRSGTRSYFWSPRKLFLKPRKNLPAKFKLFLKTAEYYPQQVVEEPANPGDHGEPWEECSDFGPLTILPLIQMIREPVFQPPDRTP